MEPLPQKTYVLGGVLNLTHSNWERLSNNIWAEKCGSRNGTMEMSRRKYVLGSRSTGHQARTMGSLGSRPWGYEKQCILHVNNWPGGWSGRGREGAAEMWANGSRLIWHLIDKEVTARARGLGDEDVWWASLWRVSWESWHSPLLSHRLLGCSEWKHHDGRLHRTICGRAATRLTPCSKRDAVSFTASESVYCPSFVSVAQQHNFKEERVSSGCNSTL